MTRRNRFLAALSVALFAACLAGAHAQAAGNWITDGEARSRPGLGGVFGISSQDGTYTFQGSNVATTTIFAFVQYSGALQSSLEVGDVIYNVNNFYFTTPYAMHRYVNSLAPGSLATVYYWRPSQNMASYATTITVGSFAFLSRQPPVAKPTLYTFAPRKPAPYDSATCDGLDDEQADLNADIRGLTSDFPLTSIATLNCFVRNKADCEAAACLYLWAYSGQCREYGSQASAIGTRQRSIDRRRSAADCVARTRSLAN